ncbi:MAG TPA: response regulator [Limnochordia bacterium]|jgi:Response regulator containing CheY-like receiver, AAA-type ATPase, and DNA-binding domains|nr:response regulator [Limnochordia bacterium]
MALVLVVDDAAFMRMRLKNVLVQDGHEVIEAGNGVEAIEMYRQHRPDLVMMDITMPEMDGITALKKILQDDPSAKIVICSALGQESTVIEAIKSGAKDFIVKPFQPERILDAVKKQVG